MTMREAIRHKAAHRCSNLRAVVGDVFAVENRCSAGQIISIEDHVAPDGRVVNVADLMCLYPPLLHPHSLEEARFLDIFTAARPIIVASHGYQRVIHAIVHGRSRAERFHVRGFLEEGTTTTPFDMVVRNEMSRFHLCLEALRWSDYPQAGPLMDWCQDMLARHQTYTREHCEDMPEVRDWVWTDM
jgi:xylulose-5-phosphate/fructose-6-phosphate phosphoketolase